MKVLSHLKRAKKPILDPFGEKYLILPIIKKGKEAHSTLTAIVHPCLLRHCTQQPKVETMQLSGSR